MRKKGKLIVFEGLDKSGKETQAKLLVNFLLKKGYDVIYEDEPTSSNPIGLFIKGWLNKEHDIKSGKAIALLYTADRYEHLETRILPALSNGKIVILDRYYYSTMAYENALYGVDISWIEQVNKFATIPDLVIYLKVRPEECMRRARIMGEQDRHEKLELLRRVEKIYEDISRLYRNFIVINGEGNVNEIFDYIKRIVETKLKI